VVAIRADSRPLEGQTAILGRAVADAAGVRVNAVAPSLAMHPFLAKVSDADFLAELASREAFGRPAEPWEVATVIAFLASDYSTYLTGDRSSP
jgi:3-oxoacyl-[acyl-carrier protein] reductase